MLFRHRTTAALVALLAAMSALLSLRAQDAVPARLSAAPSSTDWPRYGGTLENNHYSALAQINRENVGRLQMAWQFDTGEEGGLQTSPIIVNGVLYGITPTQKFFALGGAALQRLVKDLLNLLPSFHCPTSRHCSVPGAATPGRNSNRA